MTNLNFEYQIYPTIKQQNIMWQWLDLSQKVYTFALGECKHWIKRGLITVGQILTQSVEEKKIRVVEEAVARLCQQIRNLKGKPTNPKHYAIASLLGKCQSSRINIIR